MVDTLDTDALTVKDAIGSVDGINTTFQTPEPYQPGSIAAVIGGVVEFTRTIETGPTTVQIIPAPNPGDHVRLKYAKA